MALSMAQTSNQGLGIIPGANTGNPTGIAGIMDSMSPYMLQSADPFTKNQGTVPGGSGKTAGAWASDASHFGFLSNPLQLGPNNMTSNIPGTFGASSLPGISIPGLNVVPGYDPSQLVGGNTASNYDLLFGKQLTDQFGGFGSQIYSFLKGGAGYNPAVAQAQINQMLPLEARGAARILDAFGASGQRFSSTAAIGLGDFESQFAANAQSILAQEYTHSVDLYAQMLTNLFDPAQNQAANQMNTGDIISSVLGAVGSIATLFG